MSAEKLLQRAKVIGCEEMVKKLLDSGLGESYILDRIFEEAGKGRACRVVSLDQIDDDMLARALTSPILIDL